MTNSEDDEPAEPQEEEEEGDEEHNRMVQLLWQLQGQAGEGNLDEIFQRLAAHLPPKASASAVNDSPQAKLNEEMYQAVRDGDITHFQACMARGTFLHLTTPLPGLLEGHIQIQFCFSLYIVRRFCQNVEAKQCFNNRKNGAFKEDGTFVILTYSFIFHGS